MEKAILKNSYLKYCNLLYISFLVYLSLSCINTVKGQPDSLYNALKKSKSDTTTIITLLNIANYKSFENVDSMLWYSTRALEISKKINYTKGLARSYHLVGRAYTANGLYENALENLLMAKTIYTNNKEDYNLCGVLLNIGNVYWYSEKFKEAKEIYLEALERNKKSGNSINKAGAYQNLGLIFGKFNKKDSALYFLKKAYHSQLEMGNVPAQALTLFNIGDFYLHINKYDSAIYFYNHTLDKYDELKPSSKAKIFVSLALVHLKVGNIKLAEQYAKTAFPKAKESRSLSALSDYYHVIYQIDSVKGDFKRANNSLIEYYSLKGKMINEKNEAKLSTYHMLYRIEKEEKELNKLKIENEKIKSKDLRDKLYFFISMALILFLLAVSIMIYMLFKIKVKKNDELELKNNELIEQKNELEALNEEISAQTEVLADKNNELECLLEQLKETKMQLIHAEKMASVGLLAAGISHEVNTPLYHITGSLKILENSLLEFNENVKKGHGSNNEELLKVIQEMICYINIGTQNISKIVNSLMTFAFSGNKKHTPEDIHSIIENTLSLICHYIPSNIQIEKKYNKLPQVPCLPDLLHQVIINIITNAVNAIKSKEVQSNEKIIIETGLSEDKTNIILKITNTGPFISSQQIKNIFDPFFTTKKNGKGMGLGLPICYNIIVKEHAGSIEAYNLSNGVVFCISLPC